MKNQAQVDRRRLLLYAVWLALSIALFWQPFHAIVRYSLANGDASHLLLIPFVSAWLIYTERNEIFTKISSDYALAAALFAISAIICLWTLRSHSSLAQTDLLALYAFALVLLWVSGFALVFGRAALKNARFSLLFLLLFIPLPEALLNRSIYYLQEGSADVAQLIFDVVGVPALREGFVFHLPHFSVEVAQECSGIRSSMALLILALIAGHFLLRSFWRQAVFVAAGLVIMAVKNGIRIATLSILAEYMNRGFLYGRLHHEGGVVFFLIGLVLLLPVLWLLQRGERRGQPP